MEDKFSVLKKYFGYDSFREGQEFIIDNILNKKDVVAVMPTGAGKSVCFQVPAILFSGITIVVSPLISLMKDQVFGLNQMGIKSAFINSSLSQNQINKALENAKSGVYKIIYVAPERLFTDNFMDFALNTEISMVTVDEAHCISQWGQDFRPSYTRIKQFIEKLPITPVISCFTATATKSVREDIINRFELKNYELLITGFDRVNLHFKVEKPKTKKKSLLNFLKTKKDQSGVIYCSTRKDVDSVTEFLVENGFNAKPYHAGLSDIDRHNNQDEFIFDKVDIIVATNAFGMGIDKSNVTFVVHYNMPKDIESYYQEAGRAGRDGSESECVLYFSDKDVQTNLFLIENGQSSERIDFDTRELIKKQDRIRLKTMIKYCNTSNCLRNYILEYFGEKDKKPCGNCGSCNTTYITKDVSVESQKILSCVVRANEKYGVNTIIDILKGSKNQKIKSFGLDKLSTYGILTMPKDEIKLIISYLESEQFLETVYENDFSILKLGINSDRILKGREKIEMNIVENFVEIDLEKETVAVDNNLFNRLKQVRLNIAEKENTPAFVIFHNSTLIDMCMILPTNESEFLEVSGVGEVKCNKYGKYFIDEINDYLVQKESGQIVIEENNLEVSIPKEEVTLNIVTDEINCYLIQKGIKKITNKTIVDWLIHNEMLIDVDNKQNLTQKGIEIGLKVNNLISEKGTEYQQIMSSEKSSKYILNSLEEIVK